MSIKFRLIFSYVGMIVIPIIMILSLNFMLSSYDVDENQGLFTNTNPFRMTWKFGKINSEISRKINIQALKNVDRLGDVSYIQSLDKGLNEVYAGIILKKDNGILYASKILDHKGFLSSLPHFNTQFNSEDYLNYHNEYMIYSQNDYVLSDGSSVSLFIAINHTLGKTELKKNRDKMLLIIIGILIFTTLILTYSMYRDIVKSIGDLKHATKEIKDGNLDYEVKKHLNDEIGDLSIAFEEMRLRLRNSLNIQRKYEENRKNLISNISHDLKTPIMAIKGYIEGIRDGIAHSPEKMDKYIETIYKKSCDMENLINELFLFSKLDLKEIDFDFQRINIVGYLKYCVEDVGFDLEKKGGKIRLNKNEQSIFVMADLQKLKRVIMNIVENSMKYMKEEPLLIDINVENKDEFVVIEIKDNGLGISMEDIPYIFDRFYRADKSRNTSIGGSGLGLAISKQIIEKHGGKIWAESHMNVGTSIFISLKKCSGGRVDHEKSINH